MQDQWEKIQKKWFGIVILNSGRVLKREYILNERLRRIVAIIMFPPLL